MTTKQKTRKKENSRKADIAKAERLAEKLSTWKKGTAAYAALELRVEDLRAGKGVSSLSGLSNAIRGFSKKTRGA